MSKKPTFDSVFGSIEAFFDQLPTKAFSEKTLRQILVEKRKEWGLSESKKASSFIQFLEEKETLYPSTFFDKSNHPKIVYTWKTQNDLTIIAGLNKAAYFTHYTAMFIHQLTLQIPKMYYLNFEHYPQKNTGAILTQENIDNAFAKPQRKTTHTLTYKSQRVFILNGKYTGKLGVIKRENKEEFCHYTDLERTLIDIAIRPVYAGGVFEVLEAYKKSKAIVDIKKLSNYLKKLDFIYPYHQVIGFYLERAGYPESDLKLFEKDIQFNFYLTYDIRNKEFSQRWKLYFPKEI